MNILSRVSDEQISDEYRKRFELKKGDIITSSKDAAKHFNSVIGKRLDKELFGVIFLNGRNQVITTEIMFEGSVTQSVVYPREIIKRILELDASSIIISHNHPSGNLNPSTHDISITKRIKEACKTIDCQLHDHLIVVYNGEFTSFADRGLL
jgi:DNA repair protein RadC